MKATITILALALSLSAMARDGVFCKAGITGAVYSATEGDGHFECNEALREGDACFTGKRKAVIKLINARAFDWDEEWLDEAHYSGRDAIAYTYVDGPNELQEKVTMKRCPADFFN